jgi:hypothetical protein
MLGHCASVAPAKSPEVAMLVNVTAVPPMLDTVTVCVALVVPTAWLPNVSVVGAIEIVPPAPAVPVPVSVIVVVCGVWLPALVYVTVTVPVSVPVAVGVNVTFSTQLDPSVLPATKVAGQLSVSPKFALATMFEIVTKLVPTFVIATGWDALIVFCTWLPKASVVGFAVTFALDKLPACTNTFESNAKSFASATASLM